MPFPPHRKHQISITMTTQSLFTVKNIPTQCAQNTQFSNATQSAVHNDKRPSKAKPEQSCKWSLNNEVPVTSRLPITVFATINQQNAQ
jgi:hypothetical protein